MAKEFASLGEFLMYFERKLALQKSKEVKALELSAKLLQTAAKEKFGVYQAAIGDYPRWAPLDQSTREQRVRLGYSADEPLYRDGSLLKDSIQKTVDPIKMEAVVGSTEQVMVYQEMGTATIPPRPVLGPTGLENEKLILDIFRKTIMSTFGVRQINAEAQHD